MSDSLTETVLSPETANTTKTPERTASGAAVKQAAASEPLLFYRSGLPAGPSVGPSNDQVPESSQNLTEPPRLQPGSVQSAGSTRRASAKNRLEKEGAVKDRAQPPRVLRKLEKRLRRLCGKAVVDYNMIEEGDRIMVCLSGGKDSYTLLEMLLHLQVVAPINFELTAVNLDQKQPGFPEHILPEYLEALGVDYTVIERDTYSVVKRVIPEGGTTCGLCSRLRRGTLYGFAEEHGFTKIALGHHRDDIVETLFLNLFHGGKLQAMPPKLKSDDGRNIVIRPLAYVPEHLIEDYAARKQFPIIPCDLCGSQPNLQRATIKAMLRQWEADNPGRTESIFSAICDVRPSQLGDQSLFDFASLALKR